MTDVKETFIPEEDDPETLQYRPQKENFVIPRYIKERQNAIISPTAAPAVGSNIEFVINDNQDFLFDLENIKIYGTFTFALSDGSVFAATDYASLADGWMYKAYNRLSLKIYDKEMEECVNMYQKAQIVSAMKYSAVDYNRGAYNTLGFKSSNITLATGGKSATCTFCLRLRDFIEPCDSLVQFPYRVRLAVTLYVNTYLGIVSKDSKQFMITSLGAHRMFVPQLTGSDLLRPIIMKDYSVPRKLMFNKTYEYKFIVNGNTSVSYSISPTTCAKLNCLIIGFMSNESSKETATFANQSASNDLRDIEVKLNSTILYRKQKIVDYLDFYEDYKECKSYFNSIPEVAVTYADYISKYFFICVPLSDFDINVSQTINLQIDANFENSYTGLIYMNLYGNTLSMIDVNKRSFVIQ
jgi:hypothetical protein